jgi:hypothetical protein
MSSNKIAKPQSDRVQECVTILRKITHDLEIPVENPSIRLLKKRMATYWRDGALQEDRIPLVGSNRYILYKLPRWAHQIVEITLRAGPITHSALPSDLAAEIEE